MTNKFYLHVYSTENGYIVEDRSTYKPENATNYAIPKLYCFKEWKECVNQVDTLISQHAAFVFNSKHFDE